MNDNIKIIPMSEQHIPQIAEIEAQCFSAPWSEYALSEELRIDVAKFFAAVIEDKVVGYVGMHQLGDVGYFCNIAVSPDFRRMGVASALIQFLCDYAEDELLSELTLEVRSSNTAARALYEKFGFKRLGTRPKFYSNPTEDAEIYSKYFFEEEL